MFHTRNWHSNQQFLPILRTIWFQEGKDIVARARTGSGKTLAYLLPMIHQILASKGNGEVSSGGGLRSLVLVPTKELCHQVR